MRLFNKFAVCATFNFLHLRTSLCAIREEVISRYRRQLLLSFPCQMPQVINMNPSTICIDVHKLLMTQMPPKQTSPHKNCMVFFSLSASDAGFLLGTKTPIETTKCLHNGTSISCSSMIISDV